MISTLAGTSFFNLLLKLLDPCIAILFSVFFNLLHLCSFCLLHDSVQSQLVLLLWNDSELFNHKKSQISVDWGRQRISRWWWWFLFPGHPIHASFLHDAVPDSVDFSISNVVPRIKWKHLFSDMPWSCCLTPLLLQSWKMCVTRNIPDNRHTYRWCAG